MKNTYLVEKTKYPTLKAENPAIFHHMTSQDQDVIYFGERDRNLAI
jgi:hypothetical protein